MACWDMLGQASGQPVCHLLGGRYGDDFVLYRAISQDWPEAMAERVEAYREEGYRRFQLKVGGDPDEDIAPHPGRLGRARPRRPPRRRRQHRLAACTMPFGSSAPSATLTCAIEQPCLGYEECLSVRRRTDHPFVLDECIDGVDALLRARADLAMDAVNLKISKLGGLTRGSPDA